jgi:peroxiredoxin
MSILVVFALAAIAGEGHALSIGDRLPQDVTGVAMKSVSGEQVSIEDVRGEKGTLVLFTCNACPWVKAWEERIAELGNTFVDRGIGVIAVNSNDPSKVGEDDYPTMKKRAEEHGLRFPYVVDEGSRIAQAFGATRTPEAFLFDADGQLVYHGTIDDNAKEADKVEKRFLHDALDAVASGRSVPEPETKALGCTIKWYPGAEAGS